MKVLDQRFKDNKKQYILQCLLGTIALIGVFYFVDYFAETTVVASIGATSFILFTMPHTKRSKPRYILGGYFAGSLAGGFAYLVHLMYGQIPLILVGGLAVGLAMFIMVVFNVEHPPAAALAFGLAMEGYELMSLVQLYVIVFILYFVVWINRKWFIDLL